MIARKAAAATYKVGRLHRTYDASIPHLSALLAGQTLAPPPAWVDYTKGMPAKLGMMLNDTLGDCTCAAVYHAIQVWTHNARKKMVTWPDITHYQSGTSSSQGSKLVNLAEDIVNESMSPSRKMTGET
jgi:hypothetical protein